MFKIVRALPQVPGALYLISKSSFTQNIVRPFSVSQINHLKEIQAKQEGKDLIVEGVYIDQQNEKKVLNVVQEKKDVCAICALGVEVKHTDVLILSQYVRPDGLMLPRRVTGLCRMQQRRIGAMVTMAHKAGLMSNLNPTYSKKDPERRGQWKKFKSYYDESTINWKPPVKPEHKWIWRKYARFTRV